MVDVIMQLLAPDRYSCNGLSVL